MFFLIVGIIHIVFIIFLGFYYDWHALIRPLDIGETENKKAKSFIQKKFRVFQDINVMIFLGFGFLRAFLKHHSWSSIVLTLMAGVLAFEFSLFALICWSSIVDKKWSQGLFNFQHFLDGNFCSATVIISIGALFGKLSLAQYFVMIFAETVFSTLNYVILKQKLEIVDVGGALTVHLFGAIFGSIFTLVSFIPRSERDRIRKSPHLGQNYNSNIFGLFGTLILTAYWPSFNTALIDGNQKYRGIINTYFSVGGSIIGTFLLSPIFNNGKLKVEDILNASFAGGIIVSGCCNIIKDFWISIFLGIFASWICSALYFSLNKKLIEKGYHDTSSILIYQGIPAFLGGIASSIFVGSLANWGQSPNPKEEYHVLIGGILNYTNFTHDWSYGPRGGVQFASIFITIAIAAASGLVAGFSIKFCNCNIAIRYFNDSEFFDVSDCEPFPWEDEKVELKVRNSIQGVN